MFYGKSVGEAFFARRCALANWGMGGRTDGRTTGGRDPRRDRFTTSDAKNWGSPHLPGSTYEEGEDSRADFFVHVPEFKLQRLCRKRRRRRKKRRRRRIA